MKKYVKPDVAYENFELNNTVASGCRDSLNHTRNSCEYDLSGIGLPGLVLYQGGNCNADWEALGEEYCEFTGSDTSLVSLFTS